MAARLQQVSSKTAARLQPDCSQSAARQQQDSSQTAAGQQSDYSKTTARMEKGRVLRPLTGSYNPCSLPNSTPQTPLLICKRITRKKGESSNEEKDWTSRIQYGSRFTWSDRLKYVGDGSHNGYSDYFGDNDHRGIVMMIK